MAELVDALASGASGSNIVRVQISQWAPNLKFFPENKLMKKGFIDIIVAILIIIVAVLIFVIKPNASNETWSDISDSSTPKPKASEMMNRISIGMTYDEVIEIIGSKGEKTDDNEYVYEFDDDTALKISVTGEDDKSENRIISIMMDILRKNIDNGNVNFSGTYEIQKKLDAGNELYYKDIFEMLGGIHGTLYKINGGFHTTKDGTITFLWSQFQYYWRKKNDFFFATFDDDGKCEFIDGPFQWTSDVFKRRRFVEPH